MRNRKVRDGVTVNAIAGTHVVLLGLNLADSKRDGCLGFAIQREDHTENERYWLKGMKTFPTTDPGLGPGGQVSSRQHPFQAFQWADYSAKPDHDYTYTVVPLAGTPGNLHEVANVPVRIGTEPEIGATHSVFFNRGAAATQEYARRFQNKSPAEVGVPAYNWLSRGLKEGLIGFIDRARDQGYGLYGAVYEFQWPEVLKAIKNAKVNGAKIRILYDAIPGGPITKNEKAISDGSLKTVCEGRTKGKIMHNKFLVLTRDGQPQSVWTGSTNVTENGLFGHSNVGHILEDPAVAEMYLQYWHELKGDPDIPSEKAWMAANNIAPPSPWTADITPVFSPRKGLSVLDWYAQIASAGPLFMTFAFGMHKKFQAVYEQADNTLRFALMEKEGNGAGLKQGRKDVARIRQRPNVVVALGNHITTNSFDHWLKELDKIVKEAQVRFIHTKYLLVDPLGPAPVVIVGSANFSGASTNSNDENMVVIRNEKHVADIYLGEFMRLYSHYAFRESVARVQAKDISPQEWHPQHLVEDDSWQADHFKASHQRCLRRTYFAGS
jgi:phosphatidylserine/phosphatidylglycerophosphate/cardiolipin synthase-like enzyme